MYKGTLVGRNLVGGNLECIFTKRNNIPYQNPYRLIFQVALGLPNFPLFLYQFRSLMKQNCCIFLICHSVCYVDNDMLTRRCVRCPMPITPDTIWLGIKGIEHFYGSRHRIVDNIRLGLVLLRSWELSLTLQFLFDECLNCK